MLLRAVQSGASDVHLKIGQPPVLRRDGTLLPLDGRPALDHAQLARVLDTVTESDPARRQSFDATGELDLAYTPTGPSALPRQRLSPARRDLVRLPRDPDRVPNFEMLGLPPGVSVLAEEHRGLVLVTGATGSGKSTTLAAIVGHINATRRQHIVTIEDPIEILHDDRDCIVNQREVGLDTASFGAGPPARAAPGPRRDPDRRAPRRRDRPDGDAGGRVRPPRALDACTRSTPPRRSAG